MHALSVTCGSELFRGTLSSEVAAPPRAAALASSSACATARAAAAAETAALPTSHERNLPFPDPEDEPEADEEHATELVRAAGSATVRLSSVEARSTCALAAESIAS